MSSITKKTIDSHLPPPPNKDCSLLNKNQFCQCQNATFCSKGTVRKILTPTESEIIKSGNELEAGILANAICRRLNISRPTLYQ